MENGPTKQDPSYVWLWLLSLPIMFLLSVVVAFVQKYINSCSMLQIYADASLGLDQLCRVALLVWKYILEGNI